MNSNEQKNEDNHINTREISANRKKNKNRKIESNEDENDKKP